MDLSNQVTGEVNIVTFSYNDVADSSKDLTAKIEEAFGPDGYGICIVKDIPNYVDLRAKLLPLSRKLGSLPKDKLKKLEFPQHFYSIGWSHGREKFFGKPDFSKGSFYANPQYDNIYSNPEDIKDGDAFAPNVWPTEDVPELEPAFKELGCLIVDVGTQLAKHIDAYVEKKLPGYEKGKMARIIKESKCCKARLLHYFPSNDAADADSDWCGWHNDHGTLTGLTSAMYLDAEGKQIDFKDPESGLFIQKRSAEIKKAAIPKDCLAFQIGESAQIHSGGYLLATPHTVLRGKKLIGSGICRDTLAVFMQPNRDEPMNVPEGAIKENIYVKETYKVPKLQDRWNESQNFSEFATKTLEHYN